MAHCLSLTCGGVVVEVVVVVVVVVGGYTLGSLTTTREVAGAGASMSEEGGGRMEGSHHWPPVRDSSPGRNHLNAPVASSPFLLLARSLFVLLTLLLLFIDTPV